MLEVKEDAINEMVGDVEVPEPEEWNIELYPLGPDGPTADEIETLKNQNSTSALYSVFFGGDQEIRGAIVRTITRTEYAQFRSQNMPQEQLEEFVLKNFVVWPELETIVEWSKSAAGIPTTLTEAVFQYSGFSPTIVGRKL